MIAALLVDDESHCIKRLEKLLTEQKLLSLEIVKSSDSVDTAYEDILTHKPQLVFLDVHLNNKTCFDLLAKFKHIDFEIIFTTASDQFAIQAFKYSAIDYLLKPIEREDLLQALGKVTERLQSKTSSLRINNLMQNTGSATKKICITDQKSMEFISVSDIVRCEADVNYTNIYLSNKEKKTASKPLKEFENMLCDFGFFRVHQSHLINLHFIKKYDKGKGGVVHLSDGSEIEVSTRKKEEFMKAMSLL